MKKSLFLLLLVISSYSCNINDCQDYETGPPIMYVEIVDADSGENLFTNDTYQASDLEIINKNGVDVDFYFIDENDYNMIQFTPYSYSEKNIIYIKVGEDIDAKILFDVVDHSGECYSAYFIENKEVENYPYELVSNTGVLKIKI